MDAPAAATPLPASLTLRDAQATLDGLRESFATAGEGVWRIDAAAVQQLDTSALALLLECTRIAAAGGRKLEVVNVPHRLVDLARLYGVDALLNLESADEPEAGS